MTVRGMCRVCGESLFTPEDKFCPHCGAPQKKPQSEAVKFILALLKCAGYFAIYFGITLLFEFVHEIVIMIKLGEVSPDTDYVSEVLVRMSDRFCEVGIASAIAVLLTYTIIFLIRKKRVSEEVRLNFISPLSFSGLLIAGLCAQAAITVILTFLYSAFPSAAEYSADKTFDLLLKNSNPVTQFLYIAVITPLLEETLFRGLIYTRLRRVLPAGAAIILSAVIFGAAHGNIEQFLYASTLGLFIAAVFEKYDSLWASFAVHFAFNAGSYLMMYMPEDGIFPLLLFLISAGVFLIILAVTFFTKTINTPGENDETL